jgi:hypothetical protein
MQKCDPKGNNGLQSDSFSLAVRLKSTNSERKCGNNELQYLFYFSDLGANFVGKG